MDNCKVLKLDLHSKIIYFVLHLFGMIAVCGIFGGIAFGIFKTSLIGWLVVLLGFISGLYFAIDGIIKYKKFALISDNTLMICKGKKEAPVVVQKYNLNEIDDFSISSYGINIKQNGKETTILYLKASPFCTFILAGALMPPIKRRGELICSNILKEINDYKNHIEANTFEQENNLGIGFSCWLVNGVFIFISMIVLFVTLLFGGIIIMSHLPKYEYDAVADYNKDNTNAVNAEIKAMYDEDIKNDPNNPELYLYRAGHENFDDAMKDVNKAIELNPKYIEAFDRRAFLKLISKDYVGATNDCMKIVELDPNNYDAYVCLGSVKSEQEKYKEAEDYLNKAIQIDPNKEDAYEYKWLLYMDYKPEEADAMHEKYKELQKINEAKEK